MTRNQRRDLRYRICTSVTLQVGKRNVPATSRDVGLRGLFIRTSEAFKDNEFVRLSIRLPWSGEELTLFGRVAHGSPQPTSDGVGIALYANSRTALDAWEAFVKEAARRHPNAVTQEIHVPPPLPARQVG